MRALATKYRPKTFEDVVGQSSIIKILTNQIKNNAIKQAYLFTGGAGTGKTTLARIFASQIDAEVLEIDGASNNGVDNVREIREKVKFKPIDKKFKVIIIDEVHMLSIGAFNALLKILEEPPAHAVFILATTDPQKIPATILSRVQRFDFKRMTVEQTVFRLMDIIEWENDEIEREWIGEKSPKDFYDVSKDALEYIAKLAQGGMRSAISLLDTCLGYSKKLTTEDVVEILGATDYDVMVRLVASIIKQDVATTLNIIEEQHLAGRDLKQFVKALIEFVVDIHKVKILDNFNHVAIPSLHHDHVRQIIQKTQEESICLKEWFKSLSALTNSIRYENSPKVLIQGELICL